MLALRKVLVLSANPMGAASSRIDAEMKVIRESLEGSPICCEFRTSGFLDFATDERFDIVVATGYYDYLDNPLPHLQKMLKLSRGKVFATLPKRWEYRVPIRKTRFLLERGYVRFYSRREILELTEAAGLPQSRLSLIDLGRDYVAVMRP